MSFGVKGNKSLKKIYEKESISDFGNYWKEGTIITLKKPFDEYDEIIIKVGWDYGGTGGTGVEGMQFVRWIPGESTNVFVPIYLHSTMKYCMTLGFQTENKLQAKIMSSTQKSEDIGIREIIGIKY